VLNFHTLDDGDRYRLVDADAGIEVLFDRLRRDRGDQWCELSVSCGLVGARVVDDGVLSVSTFNLSSPRARSEHARRLAALSRAPKYDWDGTLEEACQRVLHALQKGQPAVLLHTVPRPAPDDTFDLVGMRVPQRHPSILFGDGGTTKSLLALRGLGDLSRQGIEVGLFDYELDATDHRDRLERLFGPDMPRIHYVRCTRPLLHEADRLRRIIRDHQITYAGIDSIGYATAGAPEAAESAMDFFRGVRQLGIGTLSIAHVTKTGDHADQKPFGSAFYSNSARSTWNVKLANTSPDGHTLTLGLFNRKANLGPLRPAVGLEVRFTPDAVAFVRTDITDVDELAASLPLWQRMRGALQRGGPQPVAALASELNAKPETLDRIARKYGQLFTKIRRADGETRLALVERRTA
jgi:hypothetical protein